jgi:hypothetical protein
VKNINLPVRAVEKLASFMERVPEVVAAISNEAPTSKTAANRKEAEARTADLVKHAGLDPARQTEFMNFIMTPEGSLKTIGSLTNKIASLQAEVAQARNLAVGGPSSVTAKVAGSSISQAANAWCEALLG